MIDCSAKNGHSFAVGDDAQCIYIWRGAVQRHPLKMRPRKHIVHADKSPFGLSLHQEKMRQGFGINPREGNTHHDMRNEQQLTTPAFRTISPIILPKSTAPSALTLVTGTPFFAGVDQSTNVLRKPASFQPFLLRLSCCLS
jgi:hypothetical protein